MWCGGGPGIGVVTAATVDISEGDREGGLCGYAEGGYEYAEDGLVVYCE
jgi:hypothetical protein